MDDGERLENILLTELTAEEIRAKRSLRSLEHQETRIIKLENDLAGNTALMQDLEASHLGLLGVHKYQAEVQDLQKQLIKLQEIQYLTEFTNVWNEQCSKHGVNYENQDAHSPVVPSKVVERQSSSFSDPIGKSLTKEKDISEVALSGSLSSLVTLLEFIKRPSVTQSQDSDNSKINVLSRLDMKSLPKLNKKPQLLICESCEKDNTCDDDRENITMLRDTLNLHRNSIESLSNEVTYLRNERAELVTYLNSLLEWKKNVEGAFSFASPTNKEETTEIELKSVGSPFTKNHVRTRKQKRLTLHYSEANGMEKGELEERAHKLWTTARKFFTPDQTNYILTAPYPSEELESESGESAEEF